MKHSKKESKPKGYSKGRNDDNVPRTGPIMIEEIMQDEPSYSKRDLAIREMKSSLRERSALKPTPTCFKSNSASLLTSHHVKSHVSRRSTCVP
jgi:hypothetical protein